MTVLTLAEAIQKPGIYAYGEGLEVWCDPLPNWYVFTGVDCPRCGQSITWRWNGKLPGFTSPESIAASRVTPVVTGADLLSWEHRGFWLRCRGCSTALVVHNFDGRLS